MTISFGSKAIKRYLNSTPVFRQLLTLATGFVRKIREAWRIHRYNRWLERHDPTQTALNTQRQEARDFAYRPLISIVVPTYNTPSGYFYDMIESVLSQTYDNWELILVDDASPDENVRSLILQMVQRDARISKLFLKENHHISLATNKAIKRAKGEFISLFDHDDMLRPDALYETVKALNENRKLDFLYTDEDKIVGENNIRKDPFFKPDRNPDFLWSINYITHFATVRKTVLERIGGEDDEYKGAQDWELFLRIIRNLSSERIYHIPKILYSWRIHEQSTAMSLDAKPYVIESQRKSIICDLRARGYDNYRLKQDDAFPGQWYVAFNPKDTPKVSIIITPGSTRKIVNKIKEKTTYRNYEIITVTSETAIGDSIKQVSGSYLVIVGEDLKIGTPDWLQMMLGDAERKDIGFVAAHYKAVIEITKTIASMINPLALPLVGCMSDKEISRHYYTTAKYNVPAILGSSPVMVEKKKLLSVLNDYHDEFNLEKVSKLMDSSGYRNLYNPYVKVLR